MKKLPIKTRKLFETCFDTESQLYQAIKKYLLTSRQKSTLNKHDLTVGDLCCGNLTGKQMQIAYRIFKNWNTRLGWKGFGY